MEQSALLSASTNVSSTRRYTKNALPNYQSEDSQFGSALKA